MELSISPLILGTVLSALIAVLTWMASSIAKFKDSINDIRVDIAGISEQIGNSKERDNERLKKIEHVEHTMMQKFNEVEKQIGIIQVKLAEMGGKQH